MFSGTGIKIITGCTKYLGSVFGERESIPGHIKKRVATWSDELKRLVQIARTEPHAACAALIHGLRGRWTYLFRTSSVPEDDDGVVIRTDGNRHLGGVIGGSDFCEILWPDACKAGKRTFPLSQPWRRPSLKRRTQSLRKAFQVN